MTERVRPDAENDTFTYAGMSYEQASREACRLIQRDGWFRSFDRLAVLRTIMQRCLRAEAAEDRADAAPEAVIAERERCASIAYLLRGHSDKDIGHAAGAIADAIREPIEP